MKVSKAQIQTNWTRIVEMASVLFRERGGGGSDGGCRLHAWRFYKHFGSKANLMVEATASRLAQTLANNEGLDVTELFKLYVSRDHRDARSVGCKMAALCGDAMRQSEEIRRHLLVGSEQAGCS